MSRSLLQESSEGAGSPLKWFFFRQIRRAKDWLDIPLAKKFDALLYAIDDVIFRIVTRIKGQEFGGIVQAVDLEAESQNSKANANPYGPVRPYRVKVLVSECLYGRDKEFTRFLDVGCGKGLPPIVVAGSFPFKEIRGFDFSAPLIETANKNLAKTKFKNVHFETADAFDYKIPDGDTIVYLYNPFNESILIPFLKNNMDHFKNNNSVIAYAYDLHRQAIIDLGFDVIYRSKWYAMSILELRKS